METKLWRPLSACVALLCALGAGSPADADEESFAQWSVTGAGNRILEFENNFRYGKTAVTWCGNDAVVYIRGRVGDSMYHDGALIRVNVETGEETVLKPEIFRFVEDIFFDFPEGYGGDWNGIFEVWPVGCSPDGEWLFYQDETYDGQVSLENRQYGLRAWHLPTGRDELLWRSEWEIASVQASPYGGQLLATFHWRNIARSRVWEWDGASRGWKLVYLPDGYRYIGWLEESGAVVALAQMEAGSYPSAVLEIVAGERSSMPLVLPPGVQENIAVGDSTARFTVGGVRQNRIVGSYIVSSSGGRSRTSFVSCEKDKQTWLCRESSPIERQVWNFAWAPDGGSLYYHQSFPADDGSGQLRSGMVRHDISTGETTEILEDIPFGAPSLSPGGDKLLGKGDSLKVLFLPLPRR